MTAKRPLVALTITQPWASLIAAGVKRIENRTWRPSPTQLPIGGYVAIHAGSLSSKHIHTRAPSLGRKDWDVWASARELAEARGLYDAAPLLATYRDLCDRAEKAHRDGSRFARGNLSHDVRGLVPYGAIVAVAALGDILTATRDDFDAAGDYVGHARDGAAKRDPWFCPMRPGNFGWVFDKIVAIQPVPCRGAQSLWTVPDDVAAKVRDAYRSACQRPTVDEKR